MRISDWSSDVCSSDLVIAIALYLRNRRPRLTGSQTWLVLATVPLAIVIAWGLTRDAVLSGPAVGYTSIVASMSSSASAIRFPLSLTRLSSLLFLSFALFIFLSSFHTSYLLSLFLFSFSFFFFF